MKTRHDFTPLDICGMIREVYHTTISYKQLGLTLQENLLRYLVTGRSLIRQFCGIYNLLRILIREWCIRLQLTLLSSLVCSGPFDHQLKVLSIVDRFYCLSGCTYM